MNLEKTLEYINSLDLRGKDIHQIIVKTDEWILVLGHLFGVAININESDEENGLCFDLEIIGEDDWSFDSPNRGKYDEEWISDKKNVYDEAFRLKIHNYKYMEQIQIFNYNYICTNKQKIEPYPKEQQ